LGVEKGDATQFSDPLNGGPILALALETKNPVRLLDIFDLVVNATSFNSYAQKGTGLAVIPVKRVIRSVVLVLAMYLAFFVLLLSGHILKAGDLFGL
jgi:hypothetical protein